MTKHNLVFCARIEPTGDEAMCGGKRKEHGNNLGFSHGISMCCQEF